MAPVPAQDPWAQVSEILRLIRTGHAQTRPELADATRLGRNVITLRIQAAEELALIRPSGDLRSRGGRAAEVWEFRGEEGRILIGTLGVDRFRVALADLSGTLLESRVVEFPLTADPLRTCTRIAEEMEAVLATQEEGDLWGVGLGMLAPVNAVTGRSTDPVTSTQMVRWPKDFDIRHWFTQRMQVPVWVESVSNLMALGGAEAPGAPADLIFVRMDKGVGSGIISGGKLHRGADWVAGEITHIAVSDDPRRICMCGRIGCLDAFAGEWAIEADAKHALAEGRSPYLTNHPTATVDDVVAGAGSGDVACTEIVLRAAEAMGRALAAVVTWFNPRRVVVGGSALAVDPLFRSTLSRTLHARALGASVEHLELEVGARDRVEEVYGAVAMVRDALLSPDILAEWAPVGSPRKAPALLTRETQS
ncbi:ROK family protein [Raineyella fluvialis]|uniref:ROK family protein n=1 Tax=Raineyella fluvialis TaxID=2662261 RepID=UPI00188F420D|nr:ROK family protein [Raineyella fluvialis]